MNSKPPVSAVFAVCALLGYGLVAAATPDAPEESPKPGGSEHTLQSGKPVESWTSGAPSPDDETKEERIAETEVMDNLDPVAASQTTPSPGQERQAREASGPRDFSDRCLMNTVEAVLDVDRAGLGSELLIDSQDGVVVLTGELEDQASIDHVRKLLASVKGVNRVDTSGLTTSSTAKTAGTSTTTAKEPRPE